MKKNDNSPLHIKVRRKVLEHIISIKSQSGYLPPERELAKTMGVSRGTLRKAIEQLIHEGYIASNPRKGNYVSSVKPAMKIGIIFGNGDTPMHVLRLDILGGQLKVLTEAHCRVQFINLRKKPEKELNKCDLDGIIWNDPPFTYFDFIVKILEKGELPIAAQSLVLDSVRAVTFDSVNYKIPIVKNFVTLNYSEVGKLRGEYFLNKGVKRVAYLGDNEISPTLKAFKQVFKNAGVKFSEKWHIKDIEDVPELLPRIINEEKIEGVVSNGDHIRIENLFRVLASHKLPEDFVVMVDVVDGLDDIMARYPDVKVSALNALPYSKIGETTAEILLDQIKTGKTREQIFFKTQIQEL